MKKIIIMAFLLAIGTHAGAQIISDWTARDTLVVTSMEEGTVKESDYAAKGIFMNWDSVLNDYNSYDGSKELDRIPEQAKATETVVRTLKGMELNLPSIIDENGIDLFMLTPEGIYIYLAMAEPIYHQEPDEDVIKWIRYYAYEKRSHTKRLFARYEKWEPFIKKFFQVKGIPPELAELCLIESGCTYEAVSSAGATGMWQIMPATGRSYGLIINEFRDDRKDPVLSTKTAADILLANYRRVGEWTLATAAYNCGSGRIEKHIRQGKNTWEKMKPSLPKETRQYIPSLLAIHYVWTYRERLGF